MATLGQIPLEDRKRARARIETLLKEGKPCYEIATMVNAEFAEFGLATTANSVYLYAQRRGLPATGPSLPRPAKRVASKPNKKLDPDELKQAVRATWEALEPLPPPSPKVCVVPALSDEVFDFRPQHQVVLFSDLHRGEVVDPRETGGLGLYNTEVSRERLCRWRDGVARFTQTYRFPIEKLWVFGLGDDFEGTGRIYPAQAYFQDQHLIDQVLGYLSDIEAVFRFYAGFYPQVEAVHVPGNHGRLGARKDDAPYRDNIENIIWIMLAERLRDLPNVKIHVITDWFKIVDVLGFTFCLMHGEDTRPESPYAKSGGMNTKLRMNALVGFMINYMCLAHWHKNMDMEQEIGGRWMVNGSFVGPSLLSVKKMHEANLPSQLIFAVHPRYGITHQTNLTLADADEIRRIRVIGRTE
jgi:hypothetical protein